MSNRDITVVLNVYKRPHVIEEQINAVRNQTVPSTQIIIWHNHIEGYDIPDSIKNDKSIIICDSNRNLGVWPRFAAGLLANTEYICVFDDDTIPGRKWFENCLTTMNEVNGLLGTIGLIYRPPFNNYFEHEYRIGWDGPRNEITKVDIVGHSWFFRRSWLPELFKIVPDYNILFTTGEDMGFSWALQQIGIGTYVPPHPINEPEMYGSIPHIAMKYGTENVAVSFNNPNFNQMFDFFRNKGFKFIRSI
jgi:GT2 family glycosyltransferase